jgi:hypothetical protein
MPEHNTMAYSRHRKEKGWDGKSLITFHSLPTSHSRDFTCFDFQRGTSIGSYSSSFKLRTTAHKCANACVNAYAVTRYVILSRLVIKNHQLLDFLMWPHQTSVKIQLQYK